MTHPPLTEAGARALTTRIRRSVEDLLPLIRAAYQRRADLALGYSSWAAYCDAELSGMRLNLGKRQQAVATLRDGGMSTRAIGLAVGASEATVRRDLSTASHDAVERVKSLDGRERPATRGNTLTVGDVLNRPVVLVAASVAGQEPAVAEVWEDDPGKSTVKVVYVDSRTGARISRKRILGPAVDGDDQTPAHRDPTEAARASAVATPGGPDHIPGPVDAAQSPPADPGTTPAPNGYALQTAVWRLLSSDPRKALTVGDLGCKLPDDASAVDVRYALRGMLAGEYARTACAVGPDGREWWWRAMPDPAWPRVDTPAAKTAVGVCSPPADGAAEAGSRQPVAAFARIGGDAAPAPSPVTAPGEGVIPSLLRLDLAPWEREEFDALLADACADRPGLGRVDALEELLADAVQAHWPWASDVDRACRRHGLAELIARYEARAAAVTP